MAAFAPITDHAAPDGSTAELPVLSKRSVALSVTKRAGPHLLEATVIPAVIFYVCVIASGLTLAYVSALVWSAVAIGRRVVRRRAVPALLLLGSVGLVVRTAVALISRSSFLYFFQPILGTVVMAGVLAGSVFAGRPVIGRIAGDFWPLTAEMTGRPRVIQLFRRLTFLWAGVNLVTAALTVTLLTTLPVGAFLALKQVATIALNATAAFITVSMSLTTGRREGFARAPHPRAGRRVLAAA